MSTLSLSKPLARSSLLTTLHRSLEAKSWKRFPWTQQICLNSSISNSIHRVWAHSRNSQWNVSYSQLLRYSNIPSSLGSSRMTSELLKLNNQDSTNLMRLSLWLNLQADLSGVMLDNLRFLQIHWALINTWSINIISTEPSCSFNCFFICLRNLKKWVYIIILVIN